ncbi:hypothetical protein ABZ916_37035 [Streptomyces sp. NPDC046853]|uniref:DUF7691 family protein n=1 Tax=Streptomyces sp. NPDC046853 TaxID=3154920 RepID=UPI0033C3BC3B
MYARPSTFFSALDDDLRRLGVSADLLPHARLFSGPPDEVPFPVPYPVDGPHIGMWPLDRAKPAADAYRTVLDRIDPDFTYDLLFLNGRLDVEHDAWKLSTQECDWYSQDTIFFSVTGCPAVAGSRRVPESPGARARGEEVVGRRRPRRGICASPAGHGAGHRDDCDDWFRPGRP